MAAPCAQVGLIDFFLPFFPLERRHVRQLFEARLAARAAELLRDAGADLTWAPDVIDFLTDKVMPQSLG